MQRLLKIPMLIISLVQGLFLYGLYHAIDTHSWPSESPLWSYPLWTIALAVPLLLLLSIDRDNYKSVLRQVAVFGAILALLALYTGYQAEPYGEFPISNLSLVFACGITLACFKALMYIQQRASGVALSYQILFTNSWRNFLVGALSALFVLVFWLILTLWGQLFKVIDIDFFWTLFREEWFMYPVLSVAFGTGVMIFRDLTKVIDNITRLFHWLFKLLLPLVIGIGVIFIAALPVVGLDVLWSTGRGTALLLWLLAIALFFTNAVYQDGRETSPYPSLVHRLIYGGLCVLPIISALSFYGLTQRLMQYGWTIERCWAFVVWLIFTLFAVGYVVGIVRRRDEWTRGLAQVNTAMGIVVLVLMLLVNSPLLDFRKISLASQLSRVESGEIELREFDFWYARNHLARPGYLAMEKIKDDIGDSDPELLQLVTSPARQARGVPLGDASKFWNELEYRPTAFDVPESLRTMIDQLGRQPHQAGVDAILFQLDLDEDGQNEYLLVATRQYGISISQLYYLDGTRWRSSYLQMAGANGIDDVTERLKNGEIKLVEPRFKDVNIGGIELRPIE